MFVIFYANETINLEYEIWNSAFLCGFFHFLLCHKDEYKRFSFI